MLANHILTSYNFKKANSSNFLSFFFNAIKLNLIQYCILFVTLIKNLKFKWLSQFNSVFTREKRLTDMWESRIRTLKELARIFPPIHTLILRTVLSLWLISQLTDTILILTVCFWKHLRYLMCLLKNTRFTL